jgi:hypothetical protein
MSLSGVRRWLSEPFLESGDMAAARAKSLQAAAAKTEQLTDTPSKALLRWVAKLGATIVSGLGLAGVVSLIGAGVLWVRFKEAGRPSPQALDVVPESQLIVQGGAATITALVLGSLAALFLFSVDRTGGVTNASALALAILGVSGVGYAICYTELDSGAVASLTILALILVSTSIGIGKVTGERFVPFAAAVFVSVGIFGAAVSLAIAAQQNFIQPAAVLRSPEGQGIRGFYIADTDDFIYLGVIRKGFVPEEPGDAVPMYRIPRDAETRLLIGKLQSFDAAVPETEELRLQLKETEEVDDPLPPVTPVGD